MSKLFITMPSDEALPYCKFHGVHTSQMTDRDERLEPFWQHRYIDEYFPLLPMTLDVLSSHCELADSLLIVWFGNLAESKPGLHFPSSACKAKPSLNEVHPSPSQRRQMQCNLPTQPKYVTSRPAPSPHPDSPLPLTSSPSPPTVLSVTSRAQP